MTPFGRLLHTYSERILRGSSSSLKSIEDEWPSITERITGVSVGIPHKISKDTITILCSSSEEFAQVKRYERAILSELQKQHPHISILTISVSENR